MRKQAAGARATYRVYDIESKRYVGNNVKKVWHLEYAVIDFIKSLTKRGFSMENLEIHKFPVENAIVIEPRLFINDYTERTAIATAKKIKSASGYQRAYLLRKQTELQKAL